MTIRELRNQAYEISQKAKDAKSKELKRFYHDEYDKIIEKIADLKECSFHSEKRERILNQIDELPIKDQVIILESLFWKLRE